VLGASRSVEDNDGNSTVGSVTATAKEKKTKDINTAKAKKSTNEKNGTCKVGIISSRAKNKSSKEEEDVQADNLAHWWLDTDDVVILGRSDLSCGDGTQHEAGSVHAVNAAGRTGLIRFKVRGNPRPLSRHRSGRSGFLYNPSAKFQHSFRGVVREMLFPRTDADDGVDSMSATTGTKTAALQQPVFAAHHSLAMSIVFRLKRPMSDFKARRRGLGRLKANAAPSTSLKRCDVDNLAKFVLDSLNGVLYDDDHQIASLHVTKLLDDEDECLGSTEICLRLLEETNVPTLLEKSFDLF